MIVVLVVLIDMEDLITFGHSVIDILSI